MVTSELSMCVTQELPRGWTGILKGPFADRQFEAQAATDLFCYNQNTGTGAFFATVKNGPFHDGRPALDRTRKVEDILSGDGLTSLCPFSQTASAPL
jgi:hypothetical protein